MAVSRLRPLRAVHGKKGSASGGAERRRLAGKVAVVTGAGSGIGEATALRLAEEGATVVLAGQRLSKLEATAQKIEAKQGKALCVVCDVARATDVQQLMASAARHFSRIDILVNNAARNRPDKAEAETVIELSPEWWAATLDVNLSGAFLCCKYALPHLVAAGGGSIVNVASTSGIAGNWNQSAYVASKHGLVGLTRSLALDYAAQNVRANAVCPGFIETERSLKFSSLYRGSDWKQRKLAQIPLGRFGQPIDVAAVIAFLASDDAAYISGATIPIDGGTAARRG